MINEIDKDFYCSGNNYVIRNYYGSCSLDKLCHSCNCHHRKHPTPEQFKEEYGEEYPDDGAVYVLFETVVSCNYTASLFSEAKASIEKNPRFYSNIVCACTPFGKPDSDWRPEEKIK